MEGPGGFGHLLGALERIVHGPVEVRVVAGDDDPGGRALLDVARRAYLPTRSLAVSRPDIEARAAAAATGAGGPPRPWFEGLAQRDGKATAYLCRDRACGPPLTDAEALAVALRELVPVTASG